MNHVQEAITKTIQELSGTTDYGYTSIDNAIWSVCSKYSLELNDDEHDYVKTMVNEFLN